MKFLLWLMKRKRKLHCFLFILPCLYLRISDIYWKKCYRHVVLYNIFTILKSRFQREKTVTDCRISNLKKKNIYYICSWTETAYMITWGTWTNVWMIFEIGLCLPLESNLVMYLLKNMYLLNSDPYFLVSLACENRWWMNYSHDSER